MVNNTVNGKKIGKAAEKNDLTVITVTAIKEKGKELDANGKAVIKPFELMKAGEFVSIKAYPGGNPNKSRKGNPNKSRKEEEITH